MEVTGTVQVGQYRGFKNHPLSVPTPSCTPREK
uniref:Uncharacterized protein n=1 Tax=Siphoviridae sp. ct8eQ1 TaxID=2826171 RepID=A0A8S5N0D6_9CAUD|nr:MAG TPA: hypothetical protein [Siphoviridae sp. ct8eQ1]DAU03563.1 MAG TPA: hypothetical protein [Caudoviricetes sp.]